MHGGFALALFPPRFVTESRGIPSSFFRSCLFFFSSCRAWLRGCVPACRAHLHRQSVMNDTTYYGVCRSLLLSQAQEHTLQHLDKDACAGKKQNGARHHTTAAQLHRAAPHTLVRPVLLCSGQHCLSEVASAPILGRHFGRKYFLPKGCS